LIEYLFINQHCPLILVFLQKNSKNLLHLIQVNSQVFLEMECSSFSHRNYSSCTHLLTKYLTCTTDSIVTQRIRLQSSKTYKDQTQIQLLANLSFGRKLVRIHPTPGLIFLATTPPSTYSKEDLAELQEWWVDRVQTC